MVLDDLGESLRSSLETLRGERQISEEEIQEIVKEVQRSLIKADVAIELVQELSNSIENRAINEDPPTGVSAREHVLNIVYDELIEVIGDELELPLENQTIMLVGLQGAGKTTTSAKIGWWFSKKGLRPSIIQTDTFREGSYEQSQQLAKEAEIEFYGNPNTEDPVQIAKNGLEQTSETDIQIVDTEGRHALEDDLIEELEQIDAEVNPDKTLLVVDAAAGQAVEKQARAFQDAVGIDGIVITKMDGTAKGGGALTAANQTDSKIAFLGVGETIKDIERFETDGFISRLLGMGDLSQLQERIERAQHETEDEWDPEDALQGEFTLNDMRHQLRSMNEMGPLQEVLDMIPGIGGGQLKEAMDQQDFQVQQEKFRRYEIIMDSMTQEELENPSIIGTSRKQRIAHGSGTNIDEIEEMLSHYQEMKTMFSQIGGEQDLERLAQQLGGGGGMGRGGPF